MLAFLAAGCAARGPVPAASEPPVAVTRMAPTFGDEGRGALELDLRVYNRGAAGMLVGMQCEVFLEERWFAAAEGVLSDAFPANAELPVRLRIPWTLRRRSGPPPGEERVWVEVRGAVELRRGPASEKLGFRQRSRLRVFGAPTSAEFL